jgi:acyl carrier protein
MDNTTIAEKFLTVLQRHLEFPDGAQGIPLDRDLEELGLNSFGAIMLLLELEETFEIAFPDSMLTPETFRTASTLQTSVQSLIRRQEQV